MRLLSISTGERAAAEKLELPILKTLAFTPKHGYGIGQPIEQMSEGVLGVTLSLYPAPPAARVGAHHGEGGRSALRGREAPDLSRGGLRVAIADPLANLGW
jgi:hypothetical protein